jgi:hypothetical protein
MLAVVEDQQQRAGAQCLDQARQGWTVRLLMDSGSLGNRRYDQRGVGDWRQVDQHEILGTVRLDRSTEL